MSSKTIKTAKKQAKELEGELSSLKDSLENMVEGLQPLFDLGGMEKDLQKIKDFAKEGIKAKQKTENEGEVCIHGNSWHSTCAECEELNSVGSIVDEVFSWVSEYPDDAELGAKVREFYNSYTTDSDNTEK